jgi:hypothetical protein
VLLGVLMLAGSPAANAQALVQFGFEDDADVAAWRSYSTSARLSIARDAANVREGDGALQFSYEPGQDGYFIIETDALDVAGAQSLSFCVKCSERTPLLVGMGEEDGSSYDAFLQCPASDWLDVRLSLSDLQLRQDSEDENAALDADQIRSLLFFDLSNLPGEVGRALGWKEGAQFMWLDNVVISDEAVPSRSRVEGGGRVTVEDFETGLVFGLAVGRADGVVVPEGNGHGLGIRYGAGAEQWQGVVLGVGHVDLTGLQSVSLRAKATHRTRWVTVLEERDGSKYQAVLELQPGDWEEHVLPASDFVLDAETIDENDVLDADQLRVMILLVDTLDSDVGADGTAQVSVDDLVAICAAVP